MTEFVKIVIVALACPFALPLVIGEERRKVMSDNALHWK